MGPNLHVFDIEFDNRPLFDRLMKNRLPDFPGHEHVSFEGIMNEQCPCLIQPVKQTAAIEIPVHSEVKFLYQMCSDQNFRHNVSPARLFSLQYHTSGKNQPAARKFIKNNSPPTEKS
jgi:hypothetical protein